MFKKVNLENPVPTLFQKLLKDETEEYQKKFQKFWKEGQYYDIYNKMIDGDPVTLAINRISREDYETFIKEGSFKNYLKERKLCDYMCQFPHKEWRRSIGEYQIYYTIFKGERESVFTKTEYIKENDIICFPSAVNGIRYRCLKEGYTYDNRLRIFEMMMYTYLKNEIE